MQYLVNGVFTGTDIGLLCFVDDCSFFLGSESTFSLYAADVKRSYGIYSLYHVAWSTEGFTGKIEIVPFRDHSKKRGEFKNASFKDEYQRWWDRARPSPAKEYAGVLPPLGPRPGLLRDLTWTNPQFYLPPIVALALAIVGVLRHLSWWYGIIPATTLLLAFYFSLVNPRIIQTRTENQKLAEAERVRIETPEILSSVPVHLQSTEVGQSA